MRPSRAEVAAAAAISALMWGALLAARTRFAAAHPALHGLADGRVLGQAVVVQVVLAIWLARGAIGAGLEALSGKRELRLVVPDLGLQAWAGGIAAALSVVALLVGAPWQTLPVVLRFAIGVTGFGIAPGFLLLAVLELRRPRSLDAATALLTTISLSLSCNLLLNLALFATGWSFLTATVVQLGLLCTGYAALAITLRRRPDSLPGLREPTVVVAGRPALLAGGVAAALACALAWALYSQGAVPNNPEELIVLRKLAENPSVRYDSIFIRNHEPTTYLFVPFQVFVVGAATISRLDPALVYSMLWVATAAVSTLIFVRLAATLFNDARATWFLAAALLVSGLFDYASLTGDIGLGIPHPNRYGFASGVLLPMNLFIFWSIMRQAQVRWIYAVLLVYLSAEMTFVHARETLFLLGGIAVTGAAVALRRPFERAALLRVAGVIGATCAILVAYKVLNLTLARDLDAFVTECTRETRRALRVLVESKGILGALVSVGPHEVMVSGTDAAAVRLHLADYKDVFIRSWHGGDWAGPCRLVLPLAVLGCPLLARRARSTLELVPALGLSVAGIVLLSGLIKLGAASVIGSPEVIDCHAVVFLLAALAGALLVSRAGEALADRLAARPATEATAWLMALPLMSTLLAVLTPAATSSAILGWLAWAWARPLALALHVGTIVLVVLRARRHDLPLVAPAEGLRAEGERPWLRLAATGALAATLLIPIAARSPHAIAQPGAIPPGRFSGDLLADYDLLRRSGRLPVDLPASVVAFLRAGVPPNQTVIGRDTFSVILTSTHYAAVLAHEGDERVPPHFIANWAYLRDHQVRPGPFRLLPFLEAERGVERLEAMAKALDIDLVVVAPEESADVARVRAADPALVGLLEPLFSGDGFLVYRVRSPAP